MTDPVDLSRTGEFFTAYSVGFFTALLPRKKLLGHVAQREPEPTGASPQRAHGSPTSSGPRVPASSANQKKPLSRVKDTPRSAEHGEQSE